jgi:hypothetical protein
MYARILKELSDIRFSLTKEPPVAVVPEKLGSAWMTHVKEIRAKHGVTMKEAMKLAKGYKKQVDAPL